MLAKGSDAGLKALAQKDLAKPGDAKQQAELGDAWIKLADTLGKLSKKPVQARALHWYEQALPKLEGLTRTRVSKQVEELARLFERDLSNSLGMKLALIPAGKFLMGSPLTELGRNPHEGPQHEVVITKAFYMGKFEVTVGEFRAFVQATGYLTDPEKRGQQHWKNPGWAAADHDPVVNVSWNDAVAFCLWLSKKEGKKYRLPTEAEWEYACRAGTTTATHFGDSMSSHQANFQGGSPYGKAPVGPYHGKGVKGGQYPGNAFGLFDMHGNVWEWVSDFYDPDYYRVSPREDPKGPAKGTSHPLRGGGWFRDGAACRSATREAYPPTSVFSNTGFRVVCEADG
jgi:formylglycine-generating enzyme required for sulfatase activity